MKTTSKFLLAILVLTCFVSPCFALWDTLQVTKEQAEALGIDVRLTAEDAVGLRLEMEIKTDAKEPHHLPLTDRSRVELELKKGQNTLLSAALKEDRSTPGYLVVRFTVDRAHLDTLFLAVWNATGLGGEIYEVRVSDFISLNKVK